MSMAKAKETRTEEIKTDAAEQVAPTVETTGDAAPAKADVPPDPSTTAGSASPTVTVYCNLPQGLTFRLPDGRTVTFNGYSVSRLVGPDGQALPAGRYGKTRNVRREDWEWIFQTYRDAPYFRAQNPLVFAANTEEEGAAIARDLSSTRHGREQVDVRKMQTQPYEAD